MLILKSFLLFCGFVPKNFFIFLESWAFFSSFPSSFSPLSAILLVQLHPPLPPPLFLPRNPRLFPHSLLFPLLFFLHLFVEWRTISDLSVSCLFLIFFKRFASSLLVLVSLFPLHLPGFLFLLFFCSSSFFIFSRDSLYCSIEYATVSNVAEFAHFGIIFFLQ